MQRIANIDKDLVIDYSVDGRPIVDLNKALSNLIDLQREGVKTTKDSIAGVLDLEQAWKDAAVTASRARLDIRPGEQGFSNRNTSTGRPGSRAGRTIDEIRESQEELAEETRKIRTEALFRMLPFLQNETTEFKELFMDEWFRAFNEENITNDLVTITRDFYNAVSMALAEGARDGLLSEEDANEIAENTINSITSSLERKLTSVEVTFINVFTEQLVKDAAAKAKEIAVLDSSITGLLQTYSDFENSVSDLKDAKQTLINEEELELDEVLKLIDVHGELIEYLDLTAKNYGITEEALDRVTASVAESAIVKVRATESGVTASIRAVQANLLEAQSILDLARISTGVHGLIIYEQQQKVESIRNEIKALSLQRSNVSILISKLENYGFKTEETTEKQDKWTASMHRSNLEFKNMNELLETANSEMKELQGEIKSIEEALKDADLGTIGTFEKHIEAYDKLRGVLQGQLNIQDNLKEEALGGLKQVLDVLKDDVPGININDLIIDGKVDDTKFNNLVNFAKEQVNKLNAEIAAGRGTKAGVEQIKIYETLATEVEKYKDAIEKSDQAIDKVNDNLEDTRNKQKEYYESILINTLTYIEDALKEKFEEQLKDLQETHAKTAEQIEKERDVWDDILEKQKERLNIEKEMRNSQKERRDLLKDIGEKQALINDLSLDDSLSAKKRVKDLTKALGEDKEKLGDSEYDKTFAIRQSALDDLGIIKQGSFDKRLLDLQAELALQEARYAVILNKKNLEISAELIVAGGEIEDLAGNVIDLDDVLNDLSETMAETGTREQLEGFRTFKEELGFTQEALAKIGLTYEGIVIDWSQVDSTNLENFEADIISSAKLVGDSFSGNIFEEFKTGTSTLVDEVGLKAQEMTDKISDHSNSIVDIYKEMVIGINKALGGIEVDVDQPEEFIDQQEHVTGSDIDRMKKSDWQGVSADIRRLARSVEKANDISSFSPAASGSDIDKEKKEGNANGSMVTEDGFTFVHGEKSPEWIFNSSQLQSVIEMTTGNMLKNLSSVAVPSGSNAESMVIENLINIEGNATQETVVELKKLAKQIAPYIDKRIVNNIKKR